MAKWEGSNRSFSVMLWFIVNPALFFGVTLAFIVSVGARVRRLGLPIDGFRLEVRRRGRFGVRVRGRVPGYTTAEVRNFVNDLGLPLGTQIEGGPHHGRFLLQCSSKVPEHLRPRLRRFFFTPV